MMDVGAYEWGVAAVLLAARVCDDNVVEDSCGTMLHCICTLSNDDRVPDDPRAGMSIAA
jgi:hypothetical protein